MTVPAEPHTISLSSSLLLSHFFPVFLFLLYSASEPSIYYQRLHRPAPLTLIPPAGGGSRSNRRAQEVREGWKSPLLLPTRLALIFEPTRQVCSLPPTHVNPCLCHTGTQGLNVQTLESDHLRQTLLYLLPAE